MAVSHHGDYMPEYLLIFTSALLAATIFPAQSEAILVYTINKNPDYVFAFVVVAIIGNVLGSIINWFLGRAIRFYETKKWFPFNKKSLHKADQIYRRYGRYSLLASWVPIIGDPITVVAGVLREPLFSFVCIVTFAKMIRYIILAFITLSWV